MVGLLLIALGTGGIKPCVAAFGGDQFQDHQVRCRSSTHTHTVTHGRGDKITETPLQSHESTLYSERTEKNGQPYLILLSRDYKKSISLLGR